jgi:hypothetical protein
MKSFDLNEFRAHFRALMASVRNRIAELDVAGQELTRSVDAFTGRRL